VHVLVLDDGDELRELIQLRLVGAPVVMSAPVCGQIFEVVQRYAGLPAGTGQLGWPACAGQPLAQVIEVGLRDVDPERAGTRCTRSPCRCQAQDRRSTRPS
jgi:hypothetical protein